MSVTSDVWMWLSLKCCFVVNCSCIPWHWRAMYGRLNQMDSFCLWCGAHPFWLSVPGNMNRPPSSLASMIYSTSYVSFWLFGYGLILYYHLIFWLKPYYSSRWFDGTDVWPRRRTRATPIVCLVVSPCCFLLGCTSGSANEEEQTRVGDDGVGVAL